MDNIIVLAVGVDRLLAVLTEAEAGAVTLLTVVTNMAAEDTAATEAAAAVILNMEIAAAAVVTPEVRFIVSQCPMLMCCHGVCTVIFYS